MLVDLSNSQQKRIFYAFIGFTILVCLMGLIIDFIPLMGVSFLILYVFICIRYPFLIFAGFFFLLPFSTEIELPGGIGTDLPSEPMMLTLLGIFILFLVRSPKKILQSVKSNPISTLIFIHLSILFLVSIFSTNPLVSFKYLAAKLWYVIPFYFFPLYLFNKEKDFRQVFKGLFVGMLIAVTYVMINHAGLGFTFESINKAVRPIFRNHVNYAAMLALVLPYFWYMFRTSKSPFKLIYLPLLAFLLVATYLSYTRAAFVAVVMAVGASYVIRWRLTKLALVVSFCLITLLITFMVSNNNFMDFAPDFEKTITHDNYDNLIEATYKMQDVSTMERVYRWVAGFYMVGEKPLVGYGPGCFYPEYIGHTVASFETYVSDNESGSGIHNYYLMVFVEQGIFGFIIFLLLTIIPLVLGTKLYQKMTDQDEKQLLLAALLSLIIIDALLIINDLIEADKVGPFYFLNLGIVAFLYLKYMKTNKIEIKNADE